MARIPINRRQYLELQNIATGAFAPLDGCMTQVEFESVVETMHLPGGEVFPLPVVLDLTPDQAREAQKADNLSLTFQGSEVAEVTPESIFTCDKEKVAERVFGTADHNHPGVSLLFSMGEWFAGGPVRLKQQIEFEFSGYELTPQQTRRYFAEKGWQTVVGFQTRNVPHRAHEYLQRLGLEMSDGLFIQPLVGAKKRGDYTPQAILTAYQALIDGFLPKERVLLGVLSTAMRYAGPREALFHAIIRRNFGCTHFIVGRDHAGVGDYYAKYAAHELTRELEHELGIQILRFAGPFYCKACGGIVTERTCPHAEREPHLIEEISGTRIRAMFMNGGVDAPELMRPEIVESVKGLPILIDEDAE